MTSSMLASELITELRGAGVQLWEESGRLRFRAPKGILTDSRKESLRANKDDVLACLRAETVAVTVQKGRHEPFPLTDVQAAYLVGRTEAVAFGGVACHVYVEVSYPRLDHQRVEAAWNTLIQRHDMLRAVISPDGYQQVLPEVPRLSIPVNVAPVEQVRAEMGHRVYETTQWPLFDIRLTQADDRAVLHVSMDFLLADWASLWLLLGEFEALHEDPSHALPELPVQFRDYLLAERGLREGARYQRDRDYWMARVADLPAAPDLPLSGHAENKFRRRFLKLDTKAWEALKQRAQQRGLTPSSVVLAAYAATIERWSRAPRFSLNLTVLNRLPLHEDVGRIVGDFTSVSLLAVDWTAGESFAERAAALSGQLFEDLDHRLCSGVEVMREVARQRGREAAFMPIVFTSAIGLESSAVGALDGFGITQTPQVFIDCQAMDSVDGLQVNWDIREGVFPDGLADDMFDAFERLVRGLAVIDTLWKASNPVDLPAWQAEERRRANDTVAPLPESLLHKEVLAQAARTPDRPAVITPQGTLTYRELAGRAAAVAAKLRDDGCRPGDRVAIVMDKGSAQVIAVLGTLLAGAVYVPVDTTQPEMRRHAILADAEIRHVLTESWVESLGVSEPEVVPGDPDGPAYVIYTSGSTGKPKGVVISHRAAANTIVDINRRFGVTADDRVLGLSNLGFDLSVYDIFGPLSVGGALVYPEPARRIDPSHWVDLIDTHQVTVWNTVPALMQMLSTYLESTPGCESLRLALLSGDWIPITLPDEIQARIPGLAVIGLGGATEAAIWSNYHVHERVLPGWHSIPYGLPLSNQGFRVLDQGLRDCPVWTVGELYITGAGLALGYLGDEQMTAERFLSHPVDGQRLYRTGDLGRYRPGGEIEFLGREDTQVKIRGHRIELGEIEAALLEHPAVAAAGVVVAGGDLFGVVETARTAPEQPDLDRVKAMVAKATERVDHDQVREYVESLDQAVLASMRAALDQVTAVDPKFEWLVRRWRAVLNSQGCREGEPDWERVEKAWAGLGSPHFIDYVRRNAELLPELLSGKQDPVALLFPEGRFDTAHSLYRENAMARYLNRAVSTVVHRAAAQSDRPLRVLEVGAGTGGTTTDVLKVLSGFDVEYLFTDVTPFFLPEARNRFAEYPWVSYGVFDVDVEQRAQGLAPNSFDVVLAAGVLENARDIRFSLGNLTDLVAPGGWLVMTEPTGEQPWIMASQAFMMTQPEDALRADRSYLDKQQWLELLDAEQVLCLPEDDHALAPQRIHLFAAQLKTDRAAVTTDELRKFLTARVPEYMAPAQLQVVDAMPLTGNGKVDRKTLQSWRFVNADPGAATVADSPVDDLEAVLAKMWAEALAVTAIGRTDNFYTRGADSLIMARMAGRLREEITPDTPFDALLRQMLNDPTIAALADFIRGRDEAETHRSDGNARFVEFSGPGDGPVRVLFHAGLGTMDCFRPLAAELVAQNLGQVLGIVIDSTEVYTALDTPRVIETLADDYTKRLLETGETRFQLVGYCLGGMYAVEVARRLAEQGIEVEDLVLVSSHPVLFDVEEDLMIESVFVPNLGLGLHQLGFGSVDPGAVVQAYMEIISRHGGNRMPAGSLVQTDGEVGDFYRRLAEYSREERFAEYAAASTELTGNEMRPELVSGMFKVFRQSFRSAYFKPDPYFGDIRFLLPDEASGFAPGMDNATLDFWRDVCLGELRVTDVGGNHFTCMTDPHVHGVAENIAKPLGSR